MRERVVHLSLLVVGAMLLGFILVLSVSPVPGSASPPPTPQLPPHPPHPPDGISTPQPAQTTEKVISQDLPSLRAVLLVGPIDGDDGNWTTSEKQNMDLAATELASHGVTVFKFYTPDNDWEQIMKAANGAHFLFYRGHGVYSGNMPPTWVGGFSLKNRFASSDDIRSDLNLAPNAIVMLYGCFTAGSSSVPDEGQIDVAEAKRRVGMYSSPFVDLQASGYYANWFGNAFQMFVRYLFEEQTLGEAYESYFDFNSATVNRSTHSGNVDYAMWIDKDYWDGRWQYNNAFVGKPGMSLQEAIGPHLQLTKTVMPMEVASGQMLTYTLNVINTGSSTANGVVVEDRLDTLLHFASCSNGCSGDNLVTWSSLAISPGQTISLSLAVTVSKTYSGSVLWNSNSSTRYNTVYGTEVDVTGAAVTATVINQAIAITATQLGTSEAWMPTNWLTLTTSALAETTAFTFTELSGPMVPADPRFPGPGYDFRLVATSVPTGTTISHFASPLTLTLYIPLSLTPTEQAHLWRWVEDQQQWMDLCQASRCEHSGRGLVVTVAHPGDFTLGKERYDVFLPVVLRQRGHVSLPWPGNALNLNGVDGYVLVHDNDSLDGFSGIAVEAWVRTNDSSGAKAIVSKYRHSSGSNWDDSLYLGLSGGRVVWQLNAGDSYSIANGNTNVADGQWHHVAGTWDGTNQVIYVDGSQDASRTYSGNGQINSTDEPITIGRSIDFGGPGRYLSGQIDDVRIWNLARSQQDIRSSRFHRLQGNEAGLIAYWPMDEAIGSTIVLDVSGHGSDGTLRAGAGLIVSTVPTN